MLSGLTTILCWTIDTCCLRYSGREASARFTRWAPGGAVVGHMLHGHSSRDIGAFLSENFMEGNDNPVQCVPLQSCPMPFSIQWTSGPIQFNLVQSGLNRSNPVLSGRVKSRPNQFNLVQSSAIRSNPLQSAPFRSNSLRSDPLRSAPIRSAPIRSDPLRSAPIRSDVLTGGCRSPLVGYWSRLCFRGSTTKTSATWRVKYTNWTRSGKTTRRRTTSSECGGRSRS